MGYTIPLDKGLTPDGQGPQEVQINDQMAREAVAMRSKVQREELLLKEKEQELCALAQKARSERPVEFSMNEDCEAAGEEGFESGEEDFGSGEEDFFSYLYEKDTDMYGGADEQLEKKVLKTDRLKPDEEFTGASERPSGSKSERPVEFITDTDWDIFGYEEVIARSSSSSKWKKRRLHPMDDDEIDGNGTSILMTDGYNHYLGLYRI